MGKDTPQSGPIRGQDVEVLSPGFPALLALRVHELSEFQLPEGGAPAEGPLLALGR